MLSYRYRPYSFAFNHFHHVPAVILAFSLLIGSVVGSHADGRNVKWLAGFVPVMGLLTLINPTPIGLCGSGFAAGAVLGCWVNKISSDKHQFGPDEMTLEGKVISASAGLHGNTDLLVRVTGTLSKRVRTTRFVAQINTRGNPYPPPGGMVRMRVKLKKTFRNRMFGQVVRVKTSGDDLLVQRDPPFSVGRAGRRVEDVLKGRDDAAAGLLASLTLGRRQEVDRSYENVMRRTGTCHLLAISGVHVGSALAVGLFILNVLLASFVADRIGWRRVLPLSGGCLTLIAYLALAGLSSSALRAVVFVFFYCAAGLVNRHPHPCSVLGWCVTLLVCLSPARQPDKALVMSALAVAGILMSCRYPCPPALRALQVTMGAILFTLPVSVWLAGGFSIAAPVCNIFAGLAFGSVLIPLAVLMDLLAFSAASPIKPLAAVWIHLAAPIMSALRWFSELPATFLVLGHGGCIVTSFTALIVILFWGKKDFRLKTGVVLFLVVAFAAVSFEQAEDFLSEGQITISFPRVGQADAAILMGCGYTVLIDCASAGRPGRMTELERCLVKMGVTGIDALFLTHAHPDHIGGFKSLADRWKIGVLYLPELGKYPGRWSELVKMSPRKTEIVSLQEKDKVRIGPFEFKVLGPPSMCWKEEDENARSMQLSVKWAEMTALFTGDARWDQVIDSLEKISQLELIKIPHHGSKTGFPPDGLASVLSRLRGRRGLTAVFPCPPPGASALPSVEVVRWFEERGIRCFFTGQGEVLTFVTGEKMLFNRLNAPVLREMQ